MAAVLALIAAICFAVAAALQQRGQFKLAHAGRAVKGLAGAALDRGKLVVVQPLLVTTIVWALPLGYWLTNQHVGEAAMPGEP